MNSSGADVDNVGGYIHEECREYLENLCTFSSIMLGIDTALKNELY